MILHLVALGANAGINRAANARCVARAGAVLTEMFHGRTEMSPLFATPAWPPTSGPEFVNAVIRIETRLPAAHMLGILHEIEARAGRVRHERWGARSLDLDLLASGSQVHPDGMTQRHWRDLPAQRQRAEVPEQLILPHPRLQDRGFVLVPLVEVAPAWRHPLTGRSVAMMAAALPGHVRRQIKRLGDARNPLVKR